MWSGPGIIDLHMRLKRFDSSSDANFCELHSCSLLGCKLPGRRLPERRRMLYVKFGCEMLQQITGF